MLVYGDHSERVDRAEWLSAIAAQLRIVASMPAGISRHAKLVGALIKAGQLLQGVADKGESVEDLSEFVHALAQCVVRSCDSRFIQTAQLPRVPPTPSMQDVDVRLPEGFAFYALYPEAYVEAARKLQLSGPPRVIGIRSIGTTLGPIVAAAMDAEPSVTVRPRGDPFARQVELPEAILDANAHYVIVDEGPGLSGSSFGAVADWLETRGVGPERIAFLPSHAGDLGPYASEKHRDRWRHAQRVAADFDSSLLVDGFGPLREFAAGGAWRRPKFLGSHGSIPVLIKFAGLGDIGERKLQMARALHAAGFTSEPIDLIHGFLVERWCEEAQPLGGNEKPVEQIGRYIGTRARLFPADTGAGASIDELLTMCRRNIGLGLGDRAADILSNIDTHSLASRVKRVCTDNKLGREEWLRLSDGRLLKTDALDHHQGHDIIGCQGVEWDIAGAIEEFSLGGEDTAKLIEAAGACVLPDLLGFYRLAYAAFRIGQTTLAGDGAGSEHYAESLRLLLHQNC